MSVRPGHLAQLLPRAAATPRMGSNAWLALLILQHTGLGRVGRQGLVFLRKRPLLLSILADGFS